MRWLDIFVMAFQAIVRNKLRSFLTTLGIIIGVGSVVAMVHLGQSATRSVTDEIASIGSNLLFVMPGTAQRGPGGVRTSAEPFDLEDVEAMAQEVPEILVAPAITVNPTVVIGNANETIAVIGTDNNYFAVRNHGIAYGRAFDQDELSAGSAVCIIGTTVIDEMYLGQEPLGTTLRVGRTACRVIGVLEEKGQSMGQDRDKTILMPIKAAQRRLLGSLDVQTIFVSALIDGSTGRVQKDIESLLRQRRHIAFPKDDDFYVRDTQDIAKALASTTNTMTILLGAIAAVSLLVGGIGIMNIMLVSVTERTREIGIRLAIGARTRDVLTQFLVESIALSTLGGIIGLILGIGGTWLLTSRLDMPFVLAPGVMLLGFFFSVAIGIIFGYFPARKAARLNPIDALRHE
ncbi:putative ABC transport system permease protein [Marinobacter antarcticus]|jgi:putative ABC transport system permease protein|uniref:Putative ABC transport system permease protein n=1 Tax=Marinobacter antarcticus TaxID=564117 RepID=A0A1M6SB20_9GAMM|nr:ABC transporter permease [Marinobacter antarcticus]SHK41707.1 putative ABC transport system permease protein [Marinobacter antarcticus]